MTARERFEKAGWKYYKGAQSFFYIKKVFKEGCGFAKVYSVTFYPSTRTVTFAESSECQIDMETYKLISYQLKELEWL